MHEITKPSVTIIGLGKVGNALYKTLPKVGYKMTSVFSKSMHQIPFFVEGFPSKNHHLGELIFLTVPDDKLESIIHSLDDNFDDLSDKNIVHCSGTLSSGILLPLKEKGANVASFHPIQAISESTDSFNSTWFDIEGDEEVMNILGKLANELETNILKVQKEAKPYLHAAAVVASNYVVTLMKVAEEIAEIGGINKENIISALIPLMQSSLNNMEAKGVKNSLTGPIARGDIDTVKTHLEILENHGHLLELYKVLGLETTKISSASNSQIVAIKKLLE